MKQGDKFFKNSENLDFIFNNFIKKKKHLCFSSSFPW